MDVSDIQGDVLRILPWDSWPLYHYLGNMFFFPTSLSNFLYIFSFLTSFLPSTVHAWTLSCETFLCRSNKYVVVSKIVDCHKWGDETNLTSILVWKRVTINQQQWKNPSRGLLTMVINHLLTGMILQVATSKVLLWVPSLFENISWWESLWLGLEKPKGYGVFLGVWESRSHKWSPKLEGNGIDLMPPPSRN